MVKYLFSDIDGTLFKKDSLDKITIKKINEFIKNGNKFYCVTGRTDNHIHTIEKALGIRGDYRISQNGCVIYDKNDNLVYKNIMDIKIAKEIAEFMYPIADKYNITFGVSELSGKRYYKSNKSIIDPNFKDRLGVDIFPVLFLLIADNEDNFEPVRRFIEDNYGDSLSCVLTTFGVIEILQKSASKSNGIKLILDKEKISPKDIYVVGDNENDICMFEDFKNAFSMINAKEEIKSYTKHSVIEVGDLIDYINYPQSLSYRVDKLSINLKNKTLFVNKYETDFSVDQNAINSIDIAQKDFKEKAISLVNKGIDRILFNTKNEVFLIKEDMKDLIYEIKQLNPQIILLIESNDVESSNNYALMGFNGVVITENNFLQIQESIHLINCFVGVKIDNTKIDEDKIVSLMQMNAWFFIFPQEHYQDMCEKYMDSQLALRLSVEFKTG